MQSSCVHAFNAFTNVLFQRSPKNKHPMPSNPFEIAVASFF